MAVKILCYYLIFWGKFFPKMFVSLIVNELTVETRHLNSLLIAIFVNKHLCLVDRVTSKDKNPRKRREKWDFTKITGFSGIPGSYWRTIIACPATPVLENSMSMRPDMGCMFPGMRFEDLRLASFNAQNIPIRQFVIPLAHDGYYYDVIYEYTCCFCCGLSYSQGHSRTCGGRRAQSSVLFAMCSLYRQQQMVREHDLQTIIGSPRIVMRRQRVTRGRARETQHWSMFRLPPVPCTACHNSPPNEVVYSCRHRTRTCETCSPLRDLCPFCEQGTSNNQMMTNYHSRRTHPTTARAYCILCIRHRANVLLLPCRHLVVCTSCLQRIQACPRCLSYIEQSLETLQ